MVRDGDRFVQGYVNRVVTEPDDLPNPELQDRRVSNDTEADAEREHYGGQLAAYV